MSVRFGFYLGVVLYCVYLGCVLGFIWFFWGPIRVRFAFDVEFIEGLLVINLGSIGVLCGFGLGLIWLQFGFHGWFPLWFYLGFLCTRFGCYLGFILRVFGFDVGITRALFWC